MPGDGLQIGFPDLTGSRVPPLSAARGWIERRTRWMTPDRRPATKGRLAPRTRASVSRLLRGLSQGTGCVRRWARYLLNLFARIPVAIDSTTLTTTSPCMYRIRPYARVASCPMAK